LKGNTKAQTDGEKMIMFYRKKSDIYLPPEQFVSGIGNWALFLSGAFLVFINFFVSLTILPYYVLQIGGTEFQSGLQNTVFFLASVLLRFYFGPLADKKGRKLLLLIGSFVFATTPVILLLHTSMWLLVPARIYQAIGAAAFLSSGSSLAADMAPDGKTGTFLGLYRMLITLALLFGPPTAFFIINTAGFRVLFLVSIMIGFLSFALIAFVNTPILPADDQSGSLAILRLVLAKSNVCTVLSGIALASLGYGAILTFAIVLISQIGKIGNPGIYFVYFGVGGIAANLSTGYLSDRFSRASVAWPALALLGVGTISLFFAPYTSVMLIPGSMVAGYGLSGAYLVFIAWLIDVTDQRVRAAVLSVQESAIDVSVAAASLLVGAASRWIELPSAFAAIGFIVLVPAAVLIIRTRRPRDTV
jgi:predicted MFS family arabinose efflux permease